MQKFKRVYLAWLRVKNLTALGILIGTALLTGCETIDKPSPTQASAIRSGQRSIVLFRTTLSGTNESNGMAFITAPNFNNTIEGLNGQAIESERLFDLPHAPPMADRQPGWQYFILEPGDYFFQQHLRRARTIDTTNPPVAFLVPTNTAVTYIGTFCFELEALPKPGFWTSVFHDTRPTHRLHNRGIKDESAQAARAVSNSLLNEFGSPVTSLAMVYDDKPAKLTNRLITKIQVINPAAFKTDDVGSYAGAWAAAPFLVASANAFDSAEAKPGDTLKESRQNAEQTLLGGALILAATPFAIAADKTVGDAARKKWVPYQAALVKTFSEFGLDVQLTLGVSNRLSTLCPADAGTTNLPAASACTLRIEPYRVLLREISSQHYSLEVAVLVQLLDGSSRAVLWQHDYAYTDLQPAGAVVMETDDYDSEYEYSFAAVETMVPTRRQMHKLDEYKGDAGVKLLQSELSNACDTLAREIAGRLKQAGLACQLRANTD